MWQCFEVMEAFTGETSVQDNQGTGVMLSKTINVILMGAQLVHSKVDQHKENKSGP